MSLLENESFGYLIRLVINNCRIGYVMDSGRPEKKYFNRTNSWQKCENDCKDKNVCDGYWECEFDKRINPKGELSYFLRKDDAFSSYEDDLESRRMIKLLEKYGWDTLLFEIEHEITLVNKSGFNDDHRGSDHTKIILDFNDDWTVKGNRFVDFAEAVFRIKSHKFDSWYELFCDSHFETNLEGTKFAVMCDFDHGS